MSKNLKKQIFGKSFLFNNFHEYQSHLVDSLELYGDDHNVSPDVIISLEAKRNLIATKSRNPSIFQKGIYEMQVQYGNVRIAFIRPSLEHHKPLNIIVSLPSISTRTGLKHTIRLWRSMGFDSDTEWFEQILHELVLVPATYFLPGLAPIHAACVSNESGALLLTGTGGVGKSSALLAVREDLSFIADDITLIGDNKQVYANFAWPKIYGYNCIGNDLPTKLLKNKSIINKLHFNIKYKNSPNRVRRKIKPDKLFNKIDTRQNLSRLCFLFRVEKEGDIEVVEIEREKAIEMACEVMLAEYQVFHKFINWEKYNALGINEKPIIDMSSIIEKWKHIYNVSFPEKTYQALIPINMAHQDYQKQIVKVISELLNESCLQN